jgi:uncharacterized Fe-S cluster protein YjdI
MHDLYTEYEGKQVSVETVIHICEEDTTVFPGKEEPFAENNYDKNWICVVPTALHR